MLMLGRKEKRRRRKMRDFQVSWKIDNGFMFLGRSVRTAVSLLGRLVGQLMMLGTDRYGGRT